MSFTKLKPSVWAKANGIEILDIDGWYDKNFEEPITEEEFFDRAMESTCRGNMKVFDDFQKSRKQL